MLDDSEKNSLGNIDELPQVRWEEEQEDELVPPDVNVASFDHTPPKQPADSPQETSTTSSPTLVAGDGTRPKKSKRKRTPKHSKIAHVGTIDLEKSLQQDNATTAPNRVKDDPDTIELEREMEKRTAAVTVVALVNIFLCLESTAIIYATRNFFESANMDPFEAWYIIAWVATFIVIVCSLIGRKGSKSHNKRYIVVFGVCLVLEILAVVIAFIFVEEAINFDSICRGLLSQQHSCSDNLDNCDVDQCTQGMQTVVYTTLAVFLLAFLLAIRYPVNGFRALKNYEKAVDAPLELGDKPQQHQQGLLYQFAASEDPDDDLPLLQGEKRQHRGHL